MWMVACILFVFLELVEFSFIFIMNKSNFSQLANRYSQGKEWGVGWVKKLTSQSHNFLLVRIEQRWVLGVGIYLADKLRFTPLRCIGKSRRIKVNLIILDKIRTEPFLIKIQRENILICTQRGFIMPGRKIKIKGATRSQSRSRHFSYF